MSQPSLFGYIGDIDGNDGNLLAMDAVVADAGRFFRYPASGGGRLEVDVSELEYVRESSPELARRWALGDVIWFAGRHLVTRSATDVVLRRFATTWTLTPQGHRMRTGSAWDLTCWRDDNADQLSVWLRRYLLDPLERSSGQAQRTMELYLAVENTAEPRRFLNTALFYHEQFDYESYNFERERAVHSGAFNSLDEFDDELMKLLAFLRNDRLSDATKQLNRNDVRLVKTDAFRAWDALVRGNKFCAPFDFGAFQVNSLHRQDSIFTSHLTQFGKAALGEIASRVVNPEVDDERV